ncbi:MAG: hypothetical protein KDD06_21140 [Phaeodactylibacter sp.]|nr:hypothetical protein [Phaeodactylibacter sp.]MCB9267526.1 hypothetical protein [Lewinellaceae bacterium]MCB9288118.1 hypothetical protein [Lewinellaceae bacterium]
MNSPTHYCRFLRGKNAYGTVEGGDKPFLNFDPATTTYWCLRTMGPVGPDGQPAHLSNCGNTKRKCFAAPEVEKES